MKTFHSSAVEEEVTPSRNLLCCLSLVRVCMQQLPLLYKATIPRLSSGRWLLYLLPTVILFILRSHLCSTRSRRRLSAREGRKANLPPQVLQLQRVPSQRILCLRDSSLLLVHSILLSLCPCVWLCGTTSRMELYPRCLSPPLDLLTPSTDPSRYYHPHHSGSELQQLRRRRRLAGPHG